MSKSKSAAHHFLPGQNLSLRPDWYRAAEPRYASVRVRAPGRVHMSVFDFSKMAPGLGGGGLGISVDTAHTELEITLGGGGCELPSARHLLALFTACVGYTGEVSVQVTERIHHAHCGLGSNVTFNTAVLAGLNALFGSPFSMDDLWQMLTRNYVENADDGRHLYLGLDTGVGEACVLHGGLVWIDEGLGQGDGRFLGSLPTDGLWVVTAVGNPRKLAGEAMRALGESAQKGLGDQDEAAVVAGLCQDYQRRFGPALHRFLDQRLRPALLRNDLPGLLALGWELNRVGNMKVLEGIYRPDVLADLDQSLRQAGALYAGMSSAGPGYFAFAASRPEALRLRRVLEERFGDYFDHLAVGRAGGRLSIQVTGLHQEQTVERVPETVEAGE